MPNPIMDLRAHCGRDRLADNHLQVAIILQSRLQTPSVPLAGKGAKKTPLKVVGVSEIPPLALTGLTCSMVRDKWHCHCYILPLPGRLGAEKRGGDCDSTNLIWRGTMAW